MEAVKTINKNTPFYKKGFAYGLSNLNEFTAEETLTGIEGIYASVGHSVMNGKGVPSGAAGQLEHALGCWHGYLECGHGDGIPGYVLCKEKISLQPLRALMPSGFPVQHFEQAPFHEAWDSCAEGEWMLWLATRVGMPRAPIAQVLCKVLGRTAHVFDDGSARLVKALQAYACGEVGIKALGCGHAIGGMVGCAMCCGYHDNKDAAFLIWSAACIAVRDYAAVTSSYISDLCREYLTGGVMRWAVAQRALVQKPLV
jgi:hypothetical protein